MPASAAPYRVALAEDHQFFREVLTFFLNSAGVVVTASCESAEELMPVIRKDVPDLVILDIEMPPGYSDEGIRAAASIREEFPDIGILFLSIHGEPIYATAVMEIGDTSIGYLLKQSSTSTDILLDALERIANKEMVVDPVIVKVLLDRAKRKPLIDALTKRQLEVLGLMAEGRSNDGIARELGLARCTVESYVADIFVKLQLLKDDDDVHRRVLAVLAWLAGK